jgi:alpha-glucuronidase
LIALTGYCRRLNLFERGCGSGQLRYWFIAILMTLAGAAPAAAEDGYDLWMRYRPIEASALPQYAPRLSYILAGKSSPTLLSAETELRRGIAGMVGRAPPTVTQAEDGGVVIGTPQSSAIVAQLGLPLRAAGTEGYCIRSMTVGGRRIIVIAANSDVGVLYGVFALLRHIQTRQPIERLDLQGRPAMQRRMLNHWDNLDRTVERGYAGSSLWDWHRLPGWKDPRYTDYARANASIGINGTVLTNVNANAQLLTAPYLEKVAALADIFRPWGIKVYLTARFSAPIEIGNLKTADPVDPGVQQYWKSIAEFPISAASWSRRIPKVSRGRRTISARMPKAPTCSPTPWRLMVAS